MKDNLQRGFQKCIAVIIASYSLVLVGNNLWAQAIAPDNQLSEIKGLEKIENRDLREGFKIYYKAENIKHWERSYSYRRVVFQEIVPFETYERIMNEQSEGWVLQRVDILGVREGILRLSETSMPHVTFINIQFTEIIKRGYNRIYGLDETYNADKKTVVSIEETAWLTEDGNVKCVTCGVRGHIFLNMPMRYD